MVSQFEQWFFAHVSGKPVTQRFAVFMRHRVDTVGFL